MTGLKIVSGMLAIFIVMPIWYFLLYRILAAVNATELMWFLFWVYVPVALFVQIMAKIIENKRLP
jgi:hypothetical protein